jgi:CRP-like cAMP-binding protein
MSDVARSVVSSSLGQPYLECEHSIDENTVEDEQKHAFGDSSSEDNEENRKNSKEIEDRYDNIMQETRPTVKSLQRRGSGLSVVSRTKVLRGVPTRLQVLFARQLKRLDYPEDAEDETLTKAGDDSSEYNRFMVLDEGYADVIAPRPDGTEVVIARIGPGSIIGGTAALGLSSKQLFTIRRGYAKEKRKKLSNVGMDTSKPHLETDEVAREERVVKTKPIELTTFYIPVADMVQLEDQFKEELDYLRARVRSDLHRFVSPHLEKLASGFFRRYNSAFVKRVVKNMDLRICRPGELIFKENSRALSMAILFCGWIDICR